MAPGMVGGLELALLAGSVGSFAGAMAGVLTLTGLDLSGGPEAAPAPIDRRLAAGAFLLSSHAIAAAAIWQLPTVGSCVAAGLGAGWMGMAAAGLVGMLTRGDRILVRLAHTGGRAAIGVALLAPLWAYVKIMQAHALPTVIA